MDKPKISIRTIELYNELILVTSIGDYNIGIAIKLNDSVSKIPYYQHLLRKELNKSVFNDK